MKKFSKILSVALLVALVLSLGITNAFADNNTITVDGAKVGETYNIYKMLDLSVGKDASTNDINSYRYTINTKWAGFWTTGAGKDYIDTNASGTDTYVSWKSDKKTTDDMIAFGKAAAKWAKDNSITADATAVTPTTESPTASWTGLDDGYYLVTSTYGTEVSVASTPANPVQKIEEKNEDNKTDKDVEEAAERNGTAASWGDKNDAAVGDTVNFRSKVTIVKNSTNVKYHDTMTKGLTWSGTAKVYTDEACTQELANTNYSVAEGTAPETFVVTFTQTYLDSLSAASTDLYIAYSATLNDAAVTTSPEKNTPSITWGNNGKSEGKPTETTTHEFKILKYDGADPKAEKSPLAGAKFQLFTKDITFEQDGTTRVVDTPLSLAVNSDGTVYRVVDALNTTELPTGFTMTTDNKIVTLATDKITIIGVDSDDYYLEETNAPTGFNPISGRIKVQVNAENNLVAPVENNSGTTLPSTGGIGTTIFYAVGGILVLAAIVLLITKKRMSD